MYSKIAFASIASLLLAGCSAKQVSNENPAKPTLVFVHGAHLAANSWQKVVTPLGQQGYEPLAVDLPGRNDSVDPKAVTLTSSAKALCESLNAVEGKVVLVAHSQGGAVVNHSLSICPNSNVQSIAYVAAVAPVSGAKPFSLLSKQDDENYFKAVDYDKKSGWLKIKDAGLFASMFTNAKSSEIKREVVSLAVREPAAIADGKAEFAADKFARIKKLYVYTLEDKVISLASQRKIAASVAPDSEVVMNTGHVPMLTQPQQLSEILDSFISSN